MSYTNCFDVSQNIISNECLMTKNVSCGTQFLYFPLKNIILLLFWKKTKMKFNKFILKSNNGKTNFFESLRYRCCHKLSITMCRIIEICHLMNDVYFYFSVKTNFRRSTAKYCELFLLIFSVFKWKT